MQNTTHMSWRRAGGRWPRKLVPAALLGASVLALVAVPAIASQTGADHSASPATADRTATRTQEALDRLVHDDRFPAVLAAVRDAHGRQTSLTAGVADLSSGAQVPRDGQVRIGSNTKPFTAVVVLQLVAEHRIDLDKSVDTYLPGLVRGNGNDGSKITVRQLLQHTSGLPDYAEYLGLQHVGQVQHRYFEPRDLLDLALAHPPLFTPGSSWAYSNTNYLLAGLLVEKITGRPISEQITDRIIRPLGLRHTYWPTPGDTTIHGPHPHGYHLADTGNPASPVVDVTDLDPSWGWAAGQLISTPSDVDRFFGALLSGKLLPAAQLAEMEETVPAQLWPGARYGLGLDSTPLSCGGVYWGHGGDIPGFQTRGGVTADGRQVTIAVTSEPGIRNPAKRQQAAADVLKAVDTAFCAAR